MRHFMKWGTVMALLLMASGCQKEEINPADALSRTDQDEIALVRSTSPEIFSLFLDEFRDKIQALIDDGTLKGKNGNGILNSLDNIERKFEQGNWEDAVDMLNALINHLRGLNNGGIISPDSYEDLRNDLQDILDGIETDCLYAPIPLVVSGLNVNLPPSGNAVLPPELFVVNVLDQCGGDVVLSFSQDPTEQSLLLECTEEGINLVEVWATNLWGNQDFAQTIINVQDNFEYCENGTSNECAPVVITFNGLAIEIGTSGQTALFATQLDAGSMDVCGTGNLSFSVRRAGDETEPAESVTFNCADAGMVVLVELWADDGIHTEMMVLTQIFVQDNLGICLP